MTDPERTYPMTEYAAPPQDLPQDDDATEPSQAGQPDQILPDDPDAPDEQALADALEDEVSDQ